MNNKEINDKFNKTIRNSLSVTRNNYDTHRSEQGKFLEIMKRMITTIFRYRNLERNRNINK